LIIAFEEYGHLLSDPTKDLMLESLHNATKGDEYRVGGVDDDNLYPSYSNPVSISGDLLRPRRLTKLQAIMRAFMSGWTGRRLNEANMTVSGEK
jgi:hypothetical protein